jgi:hypothetical protein
MLKYLMPLTYRAPTQLRLFSGTPFKSNASTVRQKLKTKGKFTFYSAAYSFLFLKEPRGENQSDLDYTLDRRNGRDFRAQNSRNSDVRNDHRHKDDFRGYRIQGEGGWEQRGGSRFASSEGTDFEGNRQVGYRKNRNYPVAQIQRVGERAQRGGKRLQPRERTDYSNRQEERRKSSEETAKASSPQSAHADSDDFETEEPSVANFQSWAKKKGRNNRRKYNLNYLQTYTDINFEYYSRP